MVQHNTIREILNECSEKYGELPAFLQKREKGGTYEEITFRKLLSDVKALGAKLIDMGLKGEKIAVIGENCYQWIVAYLAVLNGVGVIVPLDRQLKQNEIYNLLQQAGCSTVFYTEGFEEIISEYDLKHKFPMNQYTDGINPSDATTWKQLLEQGYALSEEAKREYTEIAIDPEEMVLLMFTSGTTSFSKGVMLCHRNLVTNVDDIGGVILATPKDRTLSILPNHHCFESILGTLFILSKGSSIAFGEGLKYVLKNTKEANVTILLMVPLLLESAYKRIWRNAAKNKREVRLRRYIKMNKRLKTIGIDLSKKLFKQERNELGDHVRLIFTGAAAIDPKICRGIEDIGIKVLQGYGLTEGTALASATPEAEDTYKKSGSVGPVVRNGMVAIDNPDEDGIGELIYKSDAVMMGYYNMPEETAAIIKDGWLHTGDLGLLDKEGWIYITGRKKNVIVTKTGKNIYPEELETIFLRHPYINEVLVYGAEDHAKKSTVVSAQIRPEYEIIEEDHGTGLDDDQIFNIIKETVTEINQGFTNYKRVRSITIRKEEFIKTTTKKIKRQQNI